MPASIRFNRCRVTRNDVLVSALSTALQVLLQHGRLKMGHKQQPLRSKGEAGGAFVVISGIVRVACESADGVPFEEAFLGAGRLVLATANTAAVLMYSLNRVCIGFVGWYEVRTMA